MTDPRADAPRGELAVRTLAMPKDTNPAGDIFGGWLMANMDICGGTIAYDRAGGRVATVGVEAMAFHQPVRVGDLVSFWGEVTRIGRTSISVDVEAWAKRGRTGEEVKVTQAVFTFVALTATGGKRRLDEPI